MTKFTKEHLQQITETDHVQCGDAAAMARQLLAGLEQEPVGITDRSEIEGLKRGEMANVMPPDFKGVDAGDEVLLYAAPQLPQSVQVSVDFTLIRRALANAGISAPESDEELGSSHIRQILKFVAEQEA